MVKPFNLNCFYKKYNFEIYLNFIPENYGQNLKLKIVIYCRITLVYICDLKMFNANWQQI